MNGNFWSHLRFFLLKEPDEETTTSAWIKMPNALKLSSLSTLDGPNLGQLVWANSIPLRRCNRHLTSLIAQASNCTRIEGSLNTDGWRPPTKREPAYGELEGGFDRSIFRQCFVRLSLMAISFHHLSGAKDGVKKHGNRIRLA